MKFAVEYSELTGTKLGRSVLEEIKTGLPSSSARVIRDLLSLTSQETVCLLSTSLPLLKKKNGVLSTISSDKALFIMRVILRAEDIFGHRNHLKTWIRTPNITLGNQQPLHLLYFSIGIESILDSLLRQKYSFVA